MVIIKTREQTARFIHYGVQEAKELLDFIYGPPQTPEDCIKKPRM